ncbi:MAG: alanine racemase, partial [Victivallales bacterium]|nr:alanine racemase [Victivallales bacterium]
MLKSELDTPALILRKDLFEENLVLMRDIALAHGKKLRPHAKTHKCPEIAKRQLAAGNCAGLSAAKLSEALGLAEAGIEEILITSPIVLPAKRAALARLNAEIPSLAVVVDSAVSVELAETAAIESGKKLNVLVDVDPEMGRTGVSFSDASAFADFVVEHAHLELIGVQCYAGHLQHVGDSKERYGESRRLMTAGAAVFREIRSRHPLCNVFTGTGT